MRLLTKRSALLTLLLLTSLAVFAQWGRGGISGEGTTVTEGISLERVTGINLGVPAKVYLSKGKQKIEIRGQKNIIDNIKRDVRNGVWEIEFDKNVRNMKDLDIYISLPIFDKMAISGSGSIRSRDAFELDDLKVSIAGSGDIELEGTAKELDINIAGSGDVNLKDLKARDCDVSIAGSGDCEIHVSGELKVSIAGSGDVKYKGDPDKVKSSIAGSGDVRGF